ncbi:hypothetical protein GCM10023185_34170 [Hymenobacter saemangeumensis]|uniref:Uncharacterized protein n=1 Tax=Hymenobacter saemangeumensis TaxID=1084522 RepID=A0ABP8INQ0_9BACT
MSSSIFLRFNAVALLAGGLLAPAAAQTARIAHLSHGGSAETLDAAADNFGLGDAVFFVDSIRLLSDTTALEFGSWQGVMIKKEQSKERVRTLKFSSRQVGHSQVSAKSYVEQTARFHPKLKILAYDTLPPVLKKQKAKRKKSAYLPAVPTPPQHPGLGLGVAVLLTLAGAGWLLGGPDRRPLADPARG